MYDVNIFYADERVDYIKNRINEEPDKKYSEKELEGMANYILFGKNRNGLSDVDKKNIQIETKNKNFNRKPPESLDEAMENPLFDEQQCHPIEKSVYKKLKPTIDRKKDADIPGMVELWGVIDRMQYVIDVNKGKIEVDPELPKVPELNSYDLYKWRHMLIDIRRQQFYLKDSEKPIVGINSSPFGNGMHPDKFLPWGQDNSYEVAPIGIIYGDNDRRFSAPYTCHKAKDPIITNTKYVLDFTNPLHVYHLLENYSALRAWCYDDPEAPIRYVMDTLDFYVEKADLKDSRKHILIRKVDKASNEQIQKELFSEYGYTYNLNYISTIWKKEICQKIAAAAKLHAREFENRNNKDAWKICRTCGRTLLKDSEEFVHREKNDDGYNHTCKRCDKNKRNRSKRR